MWKNGNVKFWRTGAIQSVLSENELRRNLTTHLEAILHELSPPTFKAQMVNTKIVRSEDKSADDSY